MTPAAMPDGPPSRKGPLCSVLSPLPALYFYCKNTPCPFLSKEIPKTVPLSAAPYTPEPIPKNASVLHLAQPMMCLCVELYEYNPPSETGDFRGVVFCLSLMTNAIDCAKISHKSYPRINYSYEECGSWSCRVFCWIIPWKMGG